MKTLLLARHAKSDWGTADLRDHDRPLNARGRRDAPAMARRLREDGVGRSGGGGRSRENGAEQREDSAGLRDDSAGLGRDGRRLRNDGLRRIVSSTAVRARSTADAYAAAFGLAVVEEPALYAASARTILGIASTLPDDVEVAMLVGHNPGMADAVAELTGSFVEFPTCAIAECAVDVTSWSELIEGSGSLRRLRTPRN